MIEILRAGDKIISVTKEGLARQRWVTKGVATDVESYGLLRDEWAGFV